METVTDCIFGGSKITSNGDCSHEIKRCLLLWRKAMTDLDRILKSRDITLLTKVLIRKGRVFSSSHVWIWELDRKEGWVLKNWCFWTTLLQKIRESPLNGKEIKPVNLKGNQPWIFIGRTNAETAILWPPDVAIREERPWCWERLRAGGEGDHRWDGLMASPTQWTPISWLKSAYTAAR